MSLTNNRRVADLWDSGLNVRAIAAETGLRERTVKDIMARLGNGAISSAWDDMVREGSRRLHAAIVRHHPERMTLPGARP